MATLVPELAPVRPRVFGTGLDSPRLLEEVVEEHATECPADILWLVGNDGAGKTTALAIWLRCSRVIRGTYSLMTRTI